MAGENTKAEVAHDRALVSFGAFALDGSAEVLWFRATRATMRG